MLSLVADIDGDSRVGWEKLIAGCCVVMVGDRLSFVEVVKVLDSLE
tara:strand:+ start:243 stop:380 length:138 start_codon:yes stop_codon:yes gene_type:complete